MQATRWWSPVAALDTLEETAAGREDIAVERFDVDDVEGLSANVAAVLARHPDINVLVNNAGIMRFERIDAERDLADAEATIATNLLGPIRLTNALIDPTSSPWATRWSTSSRPATTTS
jgi:uncharacterized oxidoreductase